MTIYTTHFTCYIKMHMFKLNTISSSTKQKCFHKQLNASLRTVKGSRDLSTFTGLIV